MSWRRCRLVPVPAGTTAIASYVHNQAVASARRSSGKRRYCIHPFKHAFELTCDLISEV